MIDPDDLTLEEFLLCSNCVLEVVDRFDVALKVRVGDDLAV